MDATLIGLRGAIVAGVLAIASSCNTARAETCESMCMLNDSRTGECISWETRCRKSWSEREPGEYPRERICERVCMLNDRRTGECLVWEEDCR